METKWNPVRELRYLEREEKNLKEKFDKIYQKKDAIGKRLQREPTTLKKMTKDVLLLRQKVMKTKELWAILEKYKIPIKEIAFLFCWNERMPERDRYQTPIPGSNFDPCAIRSRAISKGEHMWTISQRYLYGGPGSKVKIFIDQYDKSHPQLYIRGIITNFPMKAA